MSDEERTQIIEALMGAVGGARINGEPVFDADTQRLQIGKFVDLLAAAVSGTDRAEQPLLCPTGPHKTPNCVERNTT